jgi:uncharacterized protein YerC
MSNRSKQSLLRELAVTIARLRTPRRVEMFLSDLLSDQELIDCPKRWLIVRCLDRGMTFAEIQRAVRIDDKQVGVGTIERAKKAIRDSKGGFRLALGRRPHGPRRLKPRA